MKTCCITCFEDEQLRDIVARYGTSEDRRCHYCETVGSPHVALDRLRPIFARVIRTFYRTSDEAMIGFGGELLRDVIQEDFHVFSDFQRNEALLFALIEDDSPRADRDSWFRASDARIAGSAAFSWKIVEDAVVDYGHCLVRADGRFLGDAVAEESYEQLMNELRAFDLPLTPSQLLWRARRGRGHRGPAICAPPPHFAVASRGSVQGQPVLYLASDMDTALYEVRPSVGDWVTLARFRVAEPVSLCDLTPNFDAAAPFVETDAEYEMLKPIFRRNDVRRVLGGKLAEPVRRDDEPKDYLFTQFLAQMIGRMGFDGIRFASSQRGPSSRGHNYLLFDPFAARPEGTHEETRVSGIQYDYAIQLRLQFGD